MKRLLLVVLLLLAVPAAFAQSKSVLLTDKGVLYSATAKWTHEYPDIEASSVTLIVVTVREADKPVRQMIVPATLSYGANSEPALAYDDESETLFVFWQYSTNAMSSELRFTSLDREGDWSVPNTFETANYHLRRNLRIALTHVAEDTAEDGKITNVPEINVHATWWESNASGERARYAMLTLRQGEVAIQVRDLSDFVTGKTKLHDVGPEFNTELLRHPAIFESPNGDSVDVVFGDLQTNGFHRVTLKPIGNARVRIPGGKHGKSFGPPTFTAAAASSSFEAISPHPDRLLFYYEQDGAIRYMVRRNEEWSTLRTIALDEDMTREMAISAMRGLVHAH